MTLLHSVMTLKGTDAGFGEAYIRHCGEISQVSDDVLRKVFATRPDFNKGTPIGKHVMVRVVKIILEKQITILSSVLEIKCSSESFQR